jgi:hypothetical protein
MDIKIAADARPQVRTLLIATLLSIVLWFIPFAEFLMYPFQLFVTFIHEGSHVLAAIITTSSVVSLKIAPDTSGMVLAAADSKVASLIISSAGYVGAAAYGALLLVLIRRAVAARAVLIGSAVFVLVMALFFGFALPLMNSTTPEVSFVAIPFTVISGLVIAGGLIGIAKFASEWFINFFLSFLAVQCVLNALTDLKDVALLSTPLTAGTVQTDAMNMANATGVPAIFWTLFWIGISFALLTFALRIYAVNKHRKPAQQDLPFED